MRRVVVDEPGGRARARARPRGSDAERLFSAERAGAEMGARLARVTWALIACAHGELRRRGPRAGARNGARAAPGPRARRPRAGRLRRVLYRALRPYTTHRREVDAELMRTLRALEERIDGLERSLAPRSKGMQSPQDRATSVWQSARNDERRPTSGRGRRLPAGRARTGGGRAPVRRGAGSGRGSGAHHHRGRRPARWYRGPHAGRRRSSSRTSSTRGDLPVSLDLRQRAGAGALPRRRSATASSTGPRNIGSWAWEVDKVPQEWLPLFGVVDEIWVYSHYVATTSPTPHRSRSFGCRCRSSSPPSMGRRPTSGSPTGSRSCSCSTSSARSSARTRSV